MAVSTYWCSSDPNTTNRHGRKRTSRLDVVISPEDPVTTTSDALPDFCNVVHIRHDHRSASEGLFRAGSCLRGSHVFFLQSRPHALSAGRHFRGTSMAFRRSERPDLLLHLIRRLPSPDSHVHPHRLIQSSSQTFATPSCFTGHSLTPSVLTYGASCMTNNIPRSFYLQP
jgi:hypothetical protein